MTAFAGRSLPRPRTLCCAAAMFRHCPFGRPSCGARPMVQKLLPGSTDPERLHSASGGPAAYQLLLQTAWEMMGDAARVGSLLHLTSARRYARFTQHGSQSENKRTLLDMLLADCSCKRLSADLASGDTFLHCAHCLLNALGCIRVCPCWTLQDVAMTALEQLEETHRL